MKDGFKLLAAVLIGGLVAGGCGQKQSASWATDKSPVAEQLKQFVAEKKAQAMADAVAKQKELQPELKQFFAAAEKGDTLSVSNIFQDLERRASRHVANDGERLQGVQWEAAKEIVGAFDCLAGEDDNRTAALGRGIIDSIPPGSLYFGGTDDGRSVVTALQKSHENADPFFTLTQNAMADPAYLDYLRGMYGAKIYVPTAEDSQKCFTDYIEDAQRRMFHDQNFPREPRQIRPGEQIHTDANGHIQASGQVAVMEVNAQLVKVIFDRETNREFFVEESFPLEWMYPHLEPHGAIMKINREPLAELSDEIVRKDHEFWTAQVSPVIGDWLNDDTPVQEICAFAQKVAIKHDLNGFKGDPRFVTADWPKWMSKLRSSIGGVYSWRLGISPSGRDVPAKFEAKDKTRDRMIKEADFAYRQAFALCPGSPEAVYRYVNFLLSQKRMDDALSVAETALSTRAGEKDAANQFRTLINSIKAMQN